MIWEGGSYDVGRGGIFLFTEIMLAMCDGLNVVLSLGSNFGDRRKAVSDAVKWLSCLLEGFVASGIYETKAVGHDGPDYMNAVVAGRSSVSLQELEKLCKDYESLHGRDAESRLHRRVPIDIDIVIADEVVLRQQDFRHDFFQVGYRTLFICQREGVGSVF